MINYIFYPGKDGKTQQYPRRMAENYLKRLGYNEDQTNKIIEKLATRKTPVGDVMNLLKMIGEDL
jgi:hypothetical protein